MRAFIRNHRRSFASAAAALFVLTTAGWSGGLTTCSHHLSGGGEHLPAHVGHETSPGSHTGSESHGQHGNGRSQDGPAPCTCTFGACSVAGVAPPAAIGSAAPRITAVRIIPASPDTHGEALPGRADYSLPFANAPPSHL